MSAKILTVDDSKMVRMIVTKAFAPYGCEIFEASNGADALAVATANLPNLIFLDITMGDMSGLVVLEQLRAIPEFAHTPVIMLTAESGKATLERADKLKVAGYIAKPFKGEQLLELASKFVSLEPPAAAA
ncbi:MAG TPA: response regulator [Candidatus Methylacidiphilales bacterium]|jgi:CheY-like chemotaxis protein|nr:response regulator [Candidatus Methylacidiphilales bacterium]